jgi:cell division FtsZ-interacting protein ZapD
MEFSLESVSGYNTNPKANQDVNSLFRIKQDVSLETDVIPLVLKAKTIFAIQLKNFDQQFIEQKQAKMAFQLP